MSRNILLRKCEKKKYGSEQRPPPREIRINYVTIPDFNFFYFNASCCLLFLVISLVFITIGEDDEKMFTDLAPLLKYTITNHEHTEVKAAVSKR